jgi:hypothetical protein
VLFFCCGESCSGAISLIGISCSGTKLLKQRGRSRLKQKIFSGTILCKRHSHWNHTPNRGDTVEPYSENGGVSLSSYS